MANEDQLRRNWDETFHNSSEYQRAKQADSYAMTRRERAARDDMQAAFLRGDTRKASSIQQQLQREKSRPGAYSQAADNYQKQRVTDYIDQTRADGQRQATDIRSRPLAGVSYSGNYLHGLENPDFANNYPTSNLAMRFNVGAGVSPPAPVKAAGRGPTKPPGVPAAPARGPIATAFLDDARRTGAQTETAALVRERDFNRNLLPELRGPYTNYMGQATADEKKDFLSHDPVWRYGKLREQQYRDSRIPTATPSPMGVVNGPSKPLFSDNLDLPGSNTGYGLEQDSPYARNTMPITSPVLLSKPVNSLIQPVVK